MDTRANAQDNGDGKKSAAGKRLISRAGRLWALACAVRAMRTNPQERGVGSEIDYAGTYWASHELHMLGVELSELETPEACVEAARKIKWK